MNYITGSIPGEQPHPIQHFQGKDPNCCLADTGFCQIKVNYRRWIINVFMCLFFKTLYRHCACAHQLKLH